MTNYSGEFLKIINTVCKYLETNESLDNDFSVDGIVLPIWANSFADFVYHTVISSLSEDKQYDCVKVYSGNFGFLYKSEYYILYKNPSTHSTVIAKSKENAPPNFFVCIEDIDWSGENELIQYIIVNKDLEMSPGKIAAQVGHACTDCAFVEKGRTLFNLWYTGTQKKVILGAHEKDIRKIMDMGIGYHINDMGLTEIPPNSLTCLSLGVMTRKMAEKYVKRLQTLK